MAIFLRAESDSQDRRVLAVYSTKTLDILLLRVVLMGDRCWARVPNPFVSVQTSQQIQEAIQWTERFHHETGPSNFEALWAKLPFESETGTQVRATKDPA